MCMHPTHTHSDRELDMCILPSPDTHTLSILLSFSLIIIFLVLCSYTFALLLYSGIQPPSVDNADSFVNRQPLERMQNFISVAYDNW